MEEKIISAIFTKDTKHLQRLLSDDNTDVDFSSGRFRRRALQAAVESDSLAVLQILLRPQPPCVLYDIQENGNNILHLVAARGRADMLAWLMSVLPNDILINMAGMSNRQGKNPLHLASAFGHVKVVEYLCGRGLADVDSTDYDSKTPLILATENGHYCVCEELLSQKAMVDRRVVPLNALNGITCRWLEFGHTALMLAAEKGDAKLCQLLIKHKASADKTDKRGINAFGYACRGHSLECAKLLLPQTSSIESGLKICASGGAWNILKHILHSKKIKKKTLHLLLTEAAKSCKGEAVLSMVIQYMKTYKLLKTGHALAIPLVNAVHARSTRNVSLLLDAGASINSLPIFCRSPSVLFCAVQNDDADMTSLLIAKGVDVNSVDSSGSTALMRACAEKKITALDVILRCFERQDLKRQILAEQNQSSIDYNNNLDIFKTNQHGTNALWYAVKNDIPTQYIHWLISHGSDVNHTDHWGTPLFHNACMHARKETVELLLNYGANLHAVSSLGTTPLASAIQYGRGDTVKLLADFGAKPFTTLTAVNYQSNVFREAMKKGMYSSAFVLLCLQFHPERPALTDQSFKAKPVDCSQEEFYELKEWFIYHQCVPYTLKDCCRFTIMARLRGRISVNKQFLPIPNLLKEQLNFMI